MINNSAYEFRQRVETSGDRSGWRRNVPEEAVKTELHSIDGTASPKGELHSINGAKNPNGGVFIDLTTLGANVKRLRELNSMKQAWLAHRLGVSVQYLSAIENGKRKPSLDMLVLMAGELGATTDELLGIGPVSSNIETRSLTKKVGDLFKDSTPAEIDFCIKVMRAAKEYLRAERNLLH